jgi:DNA segregation ATPase FtsK/SpoIIIE-like protein
VSYERGPASAMSAAEDEIQIPNKIPSVVIIIDELVDLM